MAEGFKDVGRKTGGLGKAISTVKAPSKTQGNYKQTETN